MTDKAPSLRARLYQVLRPHDASAGARQWRKLHLLVLAAGLLAVALSTIDTLPPSTHRALIVVTLIVSALFLVEYLARLWVAPEAPVESRVSAARTRLRWASSIPGLIGLLAILPAIIVLAGSTIAGTDAGGVFCLLWILKLSSHAPAMGTLARVIANERATLSSILIVFFMVLVGAATGTTCWNIRSSPTSSATCPTPCGGPS